MGAALAVALTSCGAPESGSPDSLVLADAHELGGYNPVAGYGAAGEAKVYDGLLRLTGGTGVPDFAPALATRLPIPDADATVWTAPLRPGVRFSDGSAFDAADVVATYRAILDPASASEVRSPFSMIERVDAVDPLSVRFTPRHPYAAFPAKLLIGIVPSEAVATPGPATASPLNTAPIGTGPYRLTALEPTRAVLEANESYWGGAPSVKRLTVLHVPDDNTRAQRMASGELDGTSLPPLLAATFAERMSVQANTSADWRGVSLPESDPVAGDPAVRLALNFAVDRQLQRACPARALAQNPRYLILDEATAMLDAATTATIIRLVMTRAADNFGVLVISHDEALLGAACTRITTMHEGTLTTARASPQ